ncbi:MAG: D-arabinono-1,4-lactone oxidase [Parvibaculum sp.]|uniref:D-arabinono-1,4-lactone oxidase n=1 Tax=Parvibaculum sp. TaxID=2024848 RepID=UPI00272051D0|nr:D-arabinono-1,4-lactone oxidase [Parvibaculum sp.]MDO8840259.1 D-arabinono-1,4-lactone oxidase [Parvibaculum sp.]
MTDVWSNWSGWVKAWPTQIAAPATEEEVVAILRGAPAPIRVAGRGHSFTPLVESAGTILTLFGLSGVVDHDPEAMTARIKAGTTIRNLGPELFERGLALLNQGDIDRQTLAGAVGTGTHGTGGELGSLSAGVKAFRLATSSGEVISCSRTENSDVFDAGRVSFGSLGVMTEITMQCRNVYALEETGGRMSIAEALDKAEALRDEARHFEFFWFPFADQVLIKFLRETSKEARPRRRRPDGEMSRDDKIMQLTCEISRTLPFLRGPLQKLLTSTSGSRYSGGAADGAEEQKTRVRWSHDAFPSDRNVRFNEMEYAVPAEKGPDCIREVGEHMRKCGTNFLFPLEFRYVAADDAWLSPFYRRDSVTISVHQYHRQPYKALFAGVEDIFRRYDGRPHWGKLHTRGAKDFEALYPKWEAFRDVRRQLDPEGKFLNAHLKQIFGEA